MSLRALIFDVDGTLADTEEAHRSAFNEAFAELGIPWNWSRPTYAHLLMTGGGKERIAAHLAAQALPPDEHRTLTAQIGAIHRLKTLRYTAKVRSGAVPLREGVERLLEEAAVAGIRVAIATTTTFANVEALLTTRLGPTALQRFAVIGAGDDVPYKKPAGDIYEYVLRRLQIPYDECVALEDSANGLRAAKAAGLYTIVTPSYWTRTEDFSAADLVLPSLGSAEHPLPARAAALLGSAYLSIQVIERQLQAIREYGERTING